MYKWDTRDTAWGKVQKKALLNDVVMRWVEVRFCKLNRFPQGPIISKKILEEQKVFFFLLTKECKVLSLLLLVGILITGVLGISVIVSYERKLKVFLADLTSEEASALDLTSSNGTFSLGIQKKD